MSGRAHDRNLAILDGGWGAEIGCNVLWQQLEEGYSEGPDNAALICRHQTPGQLQMLTVETNSTTGAQDCLTWSYRQMTIATKNLASIMSARGVKRGDTLVVFLPNCVEWALSYWVSAWLELKFVPLDHTSLSSCCSGQDYPLELLKPAVVLVPTITEAREFNLLYADITESIPTKIVCFEYDGFGWGPWVSLEYLTNSIQIDEEDTPQQPDPTDDSLEKNRVAIVLFTRGSSGSSPKGCPLTISNIRTALVNQYLVPPQIFLVTTPPSGVVALESAMIAWKRGGTVVMADSTYTPGYTLDAIQRFSCTRLVCTPTQLQGLIKHPSLRQRRLDSLQCLGVTGDVVSESLLEEAQEALNVRWAASFLSMTEAMGAIGWHRILQYDSIMTCVGTVLCGSKVKICDDQQNIVARGKQGNLHIGGDTVTQGYLGGISAGSFYRDEEGVRWFKTGDVATIDKDRMIHMAGRRKGFSEPEQNAKVDTVVVHVKNGSQGRMRVVVVRPRKESAVGGMQASDMVVVSLKQLGREDWPVNEAGRVERVKLRDEVVTFLNSTWSR